MTFDALEPLEAAFRPRSALMRFRLLGSLRVWDGTKWLPVQAAQQRVVLSLLLLESGRAVSTDRLIAEIWGEQPPRAAGTVLRGYVLRLRRLLGDDGRARVLTRPNGYELVTDDHDIDALVFGRLVASGRSRLAAGDGARAVAELSEALALWHGPALADVPARSTIEAHVTWLEQARLTATEDCVSGQLELGRHAELAGKLERLVRLHPLRERLWESLMLAMHRSGRRAEALDAYRRARHILRAELGLEPGDRLQRLHSTVLRGEPATAAEDPPSAVRPEPVVPAQLPAGTATLVARADHLCQLDKLVAASACGPSTVVACIVGMAGIGKTSLAVHWAHRVVECFPDGQLYADLRGFGPNRMALPPGEVVRSFLAALQVPPASVPTTLDAQAAMYRSKLAGRRMLLVLDNARNAEQVRPLLPGTGRCLVVVTSRSRLAGLVANPGAHMVALDLLPPAEARQVLERRVGADRVAASPAATDEIVNRCGGLPLALAIVATRAVSNPGVPLDAIARDMRVSGRHLDGARRRRFTRRRCRAGAPDRRSGRQ
jgi:DNA-binding SARP family transcriptional activator